MDSQHHSLGDLTRVFARIGVLSFGGPAAQIALMHRELVETRPWLSESQFLGALSFCMMLPGPEAMQLATYCGWRLKGTPGGLIAGLLFVLPGAVIVAALAWVYALIGSVPLAQALFLGIKATVVVIVLEALWKVSRRALKRRDHRMLALLSFTAMYLFQVPFPVIIVAAAAYGAATATGTATATPIPAPGGLWRVVALWAALWWAPVAMAWSLGQAFLVEIGLFFSQLAVVTFGGAYAVLTWMTQTVVQDRGWLTTAQMMDALGLAETTPGPLILVTEFVGYLAGHAAGGPGLAVLAAAMTLWVTFVPCFLWIFAGAPFIDWIATRPRLSAALSAITAAVVGVILNLSLWFSLHVFFSDLRPVSLIGPAQLLIPAAMWPDLRAVALAVLAAGLLWGLRWPLPLILLATALAGVAPGLLTGQN